LFDSSFCKKDRLDKPDESLGLRSLLFFTGDCLCHDIQMKNIFLLGLLCFTSSLSLAAGASSSKNKGVEFRIHYGLTSNSSSSFDDKMETYLKGVPNIKGPQITGADLTYQINEIVLGLRFESFTLTDSTLSQQSGISAPIKQIDTELIGSRGGFLLGWRPVQWSKGYIGLTTHFLQSLGMNYTINTKNTTTNATEKFTYSGSADFGFGGGIEIGALVQDKYKVGIEVGSTTYTSKTFTDSSGAELVNTNGEKASIDFSGLYGKFLIGATF
jgi:hypothetical protein